MRMNATGVYCKGIRIIYIWEKTDTAPRWRKEVRVLLYRFVETGAVTMWMLSEIDHMLGNMRRAADDNAVVTRRYGDIRYRG